MKVNIHIEANDADIRRLATDLLAKGVLTAIRGVGETFGDPDFVRGLQGTLGQVFQHGVAPAAGAPPAGRVGPVAAGAAARCQPMRADTHEGVCCCRCGAFNSRSRLVCVVCRHEFCLAGAPSEAPAAATAPESPGETPA
jgi:hypothetical protein